MGNIQFGIPEETALALKAKYDLQYFVETGTFMGRSAAWAGEHFSCVWSIDNHRPWVEQARNRYHERLNVTFMLGDSRELLPKLLARMPGRALLWLDAHWLDKGRGVRPDDCPLEAELRAVRTSPLMHVVMVDDAHFFSGDLPRGTLREKFPALQDIYGWLPGWKCRVAEDVVIAEPEEIALLRSMLPMTRSGV